MPQVMNNPDHLQTRALYAGNKMAITRYAYTDALPLAMVSGSMDVLLLLCGSCTISHGTQAWHLAEKQLLLLPPDTSLAVMNNTVRSAFMIFSLSSELLLEFAGKHAPAAQHPGAWRSTPIHLADNTVINYVRALLPAFTGDIAVSPLLLRVKLLEFLQSLLATNGALLGKLLQRSVPGKKLPVPAYDFAAMHHRGAVQQPARLYS